MSGFLWRLPHLCARAWRSLSAVACLFYCEGRQALLERTKARTDLEKLAVKKTRMELEFQHSNNVVDLIQKVEKIKDPHLLAKMKEAISSSCRALLR
jgi:hypothetical protein